MVVPDSPLHWAVRSVPRHGPGDDPAQAGHRHDHHRRDHHELCAETTAREAHARDFKVVFLSDGTTTFDLLDAGWAPIPTDQAHRYACTVLAFGFAEVTTVEAVLDRIGEVTSVAVS